MPSRVQNEQFFLLPYLVLPNGRKSDIDCQYPINVRYCSHCTDVRFASLLSGGFTTMAVINPPEKFGAEYEQFLRPVFYVFMGKK